MINIRTQAEMEKAIVAGNKLGPVFDFIAPHVRPGVSTLELDKLCEEFIRQTGGKPSFPGEKDYYWTICASVNEGVIHQIPRKNVILKEGDLLKIDIGNIDSNGYQGDAARTFFVGKPSSDLDVKLKECAEECFWAAYALVKPGVRVNELGWAIQRTAEKYGFSVLKEFGGHGIGTEMHEDPFIPNCGLFPEKGGAKIKANTLICIEPMVLAGQPNIVIQPDNWGVISKDGKRTSHYENTIAVFSDHNEITTVDSSVRKRLEANQ